MLDDLRHDRDNVMLFNDRKVVDIIPFNLDWVELEGPDKGLPTKVGIWIKQNLKVAESVVGVRWLNFHPYNFVLTRFENSFRAQFKMPDKRMMTVIPGVIEIMRYEPSNELLVRYNEFKVTGGTTWKVWFETKRRYVYNYHDCPQALEVTLNLIDNLLYEITKVPRRSIATHLSTVLHNNRNRISNTSEKPTVPDHLAHLFQNRQTSTGDIATPIEIEQFYFFLTKCYYFGEHGIPLRATKADPELYLTFFDILLCFLQGKELETDPFAVYKDGKQSK